MCSEEFTLQGYNLTRLKKTMESENQEALEKDEALKANEENAELITNEEKAKESKAAKGNAEFKASNKVESI